MFTIERAIERKRRGRILRSEKATRSFGRELNNGLQRPTRTKNWLRRKNVDREEEKSDMDMIYLQEEEPELNRDSINLLWLISHLTPFDFHTRVSGRSVGYQNEIGVYRVDASREIVDGCESTGGQFLQLNGAHLTSASRPAQNQLAAIAYFSD